MAEEEATAEVKYPQAPPTFLEVECRTSGRILRFSSGTEAGFAVNLINKRLLKNNASDGADNITPVSHIEAVKEGEEEPVSFGPSSELVKYGPDWKLQTVVHSYGDKGLHNRPTRVRKVSTKDHADSQSTRSEPPSLVSLAYVGKILLCFVLMFMLGALFTMVLENLPRLILYINSSV